MQSKLTNESNIIIVSLGLLGNLCVFLTWLIWGLNSAVFFWTALMLPFLGSILVVLICRMYPNSSSKTKNTKIQQSLERGIKGAVQIGAEAQKTSRHNTMVSKSADVICLLDTEAKFMQVSPAVESVLGYKPSEIIGKSIDDFIVHADNSEILNKILSSKQSIARTSFETSFQTKSGNLVDLVWSVHWSVSDSALFCVAHDITERKKVEQVLKENEERLQEILENLPAGVLVVQPTGPVTFMNKLARQLTGYEKISLDSTSYLDLSNLIQISNSGSSLDSELNSSFKLNLETLWQETKNTSIECNIIKRDKRLVSVELSLSKIALTNEQNFLVTFIDMSAKFEIERMKREFVSMVSHDLRTPLTSVSSTLEFLDQGMGGELNVNGKCMITRASSECHRLMRLVQDLLDLEKMRAGKFSLQMEDADLAKIIDASLDSIEQLANDKDISILVELTDSVVSVNCDPSRITQVFVNLLDNAIKFSPQGSNIIIRYLKLNNGHQISVSNRGKLIPQEKLALIFERFEQVDSKDQIEHKGSGLGLAICKTLLEQHGGKISAESNERDGTIISFVLPDFK